MGLSGRRPPPLPCLSRAPRSFLHPLLPSAYYAGYAATDCDRTVCAIAMKNGDIACYLKEHAFLLYSDPIAIHSLVS